MDVNQNREYFTKHGLHFNGLAKEVFCKQIANVIDQLFQTKEILPTCMNWEIDQLDRISTNKINISNESQRTNGQNKEKMLKQTIAMDNKTNSLDNFSLTNTNCRTSSRQWKVPSNNNDLLWKF
jgi:hypothetical protein